MSKPKINHAKAFELSSGNLHQQGYQEALDDVIAATQAMVDQKLELTPEALLASLKAIKERG